MESASFEDLASTLAGNLFFIPSAAFGPFVVAVVIVVPRAAFGSVVATIIIVIAVAIASRSRSFIVVIVAFVAIVATISAASATFTEPTTVPGDLNPVNNETDEGWKAYGKLK